MTIAQANQIMQPTIPAATIRVEISPVGGSCNYDYDQFKSMVSVLFILRASILESW
jgi:hypothetical protein